MESFKQGIASQELKRADALKIRPQDLHEEPGFNLRQEGSELQASIDALTAHILAGGMYPALEVRPRADGGVFVVDGHRRRRAILQAIEQGAPIEWVNIVAFTGNDADRTLRVITSAEGRSLSPLETALGYKRLVAFDWTPDDIAAKVGKTANHVGQLLILANAPSKVQKMVRDGKVSGAVAIDAVRKHGDKAADVLGGELDKAKAAGKKKITAGTIAGKKLPAKVTAPMLSGVEDFLGGLPPEAHETIAAVKAGNVDAKSMVSISAFDLAALMDLQTAIIDARADQKRKAVARAAKAKQADLEAAE